MLEPKHRSLLLDNLRPPAGYQLDRAIGATFSLDLQALLTVPLAFAMFDASTDDATADIIALLEATRRHAGRMSIFCQAGRISLPKSYSKILTNVERSIHEVSAPLAGGVFHPKVWAIRFTTDDGPTQYRLLVLSRNLTFDRSWDIVVRLDGERAPVGERSEASTVNRPLTEFLQRLPDLTVHPVPAKEMAEITKFIRDLRHVKFAPPNEFSAVSFWTSGLSRPTRSPFDGGPSRTLVISPFLTAGLLNTVTAAGSHHVLISRKEALDSLAADTLTGFEHVYVLDAAMETPEDVSGTELTGLHAKVFVVEHHGRVSVYAGSANATDAGFGRNVEFLTRLHGHRHRIGVDTVLRPSDDGELGLIDLLVPYVRPDTAPIEESAADQLQHDVDQLRHTVAAVPVTATVTPRSDGDFDLALSSPSPLIPSDIDALLTCRPLALGSGFAQEIASAAPLDARFDRVSFTALTSFIVFDLTLHRDGQSASIRFVVNAVLEGTPADRHQRILSSLLDDRSKVLRYLLFLLTDPDTSDAATLESLRNAVSASEGDGKHSSAVPLLEAMLQNLARDPTRLDPVSRLIADLSHTEQGHRLLPDGIDEVWPAIWQARLDASS